MQAMAEPRGKSSKKAEYCHWLGKKRVLARLLNLTMVLVACGMLVAAWCVFQQRCGRARQHTTGICESLLATHMMKPGVGVLQLDSTAALAGITENRVWGDVSTLLFAGLQRQRWPPGYLSHVLITRVFRGYSWNGVQGASTTGPIGFYGDSTETESNEEKAELFMSGCF